MALALKPHLRQQYVTPPKHNAEFVAHMEDVLEIYHLPYDRSYPVICMDEQPVQLVKETRFRYLQNRDSQRHLITSMNAMGQPISA